MKAKVRKAMHKRKQMAKCYEQLYTFVIQVREEVEQLSLEEAVDVGFLLREIAACADDLKKEVNHVKELLERVICIKWIANSLNDVSKAGPIHGELATGSPDVKQAAVLPRQKDDPEGYDAFIKRIGVMGAARKFALVRPHWPTVIEYLSRLAEQGKPLPPGINVDKAYPVYRVTFRRKGD